MATAGTSRIEKLRPIHDHIIVKDMNFGERTTSGGILLQSDDKKSEGIRPRWAEVYAVGPEQKEVKVGEYILVEHGRWTRGFSVQIGDDVMMLRRIDPNGIIAASKEPQSDDTMSEAMCARSDRSVIDGSLHNHHL